MASKPHRAAGLELIALRHKYRLLQSELGRAAGVSQHTILRWENGYRRPSRDQLKQLVAAFDNYAEKDARAVAAVYGTTPEELGLTLETDDDEALTASATAAPLAARDAVDLALYRVTDALGVRAASARAPLVAFLQKLAALGLSVDQAAALLAEPPGAKPEA